MQYFIVSFKTQKFATWTYKYKVVQNSICLIMIFAAFHLFFKIEVIYFIDAVLDFKNCQHDIIMWYIISDIHITDVIIWRW